MKIQPIIHIIVGLFLIAEPVLYAQDNLYSVEEAILLFNEGAHDYARSLLYHNIHQNPHDVESRLLLGMMAGHLGEQDTAVSIWQNGIVGDENDYPLLMSIGEMRVKQALHAVPAILSIADEFSSPLDYKEKYKEKQKEFITQAIDAYQKANDLYPYEPEPIWSLASIAQIEQDYPKAISHLEVLTDMYKQEEMYWHDKGKCHLIQKETQKAIECFEKATIINPRYAPAYKGLAEAYSQLDEEEPFTKAAKKSHFYEWIPSFIEIEYSELKYEMLKLLLASEKETFCMENPIIQELISDTSKESTQILGVLCWYHKFSHECEQEVLTELAFRDAEGIYILTKLVENTDYACLIAETVHLLAKTKAPGTFDILIGMLSKDKHHYSLQITEALAHLGDDRAIPHLLKEINVDFESSTSAENTTSQQTKRKTKTNDIQQWVMEEGMRSARIRAIFALSFFRHEVVNETLVKGLKNPEIAVYCSAALFRTTGDETFLEPIVNLTSKRQSDVMLANFLQYEDNKKAQKLAKKLMR